MSSMETVSGKGGTRDRLQSGLVYALSLLLSASLGVNVWLIRSAKRSERGIRVSSPPPGTRVPAITATELRTERAETIAYEGTERPTVLYFFTPRCGWCQRNLANVKALVERKRDAYRFVGISLSEEGLRQYVEEQAPPFPVYTGLSKEAQEAYRVRSTPQTIVVSPEGRVIRSWSGAYAGTNQKDVQSYFDLELPGLVARDKDS